ncbi:fibronectin type III domain-containing protein [Neobacillus sp. C211]|uniref:fibronectin type III domain-containing protein n=1 Tax=unclassified Neobacillus TaxID=2675272 RepID=UPI003978A0B2
MRNSKVTIFLLSFFFLLAVSLLPEKAFAAIGDRATPYSAWDYHEFALQKSSSDTSKVVGLQQFDMYFGEDANDIIQTEDGSNQDPAADEQWILMGFDMSYISGPEKSLMRADLIRSDYNFYTKGGEKITPIATASFTDQLAGLDENGVNLDREASASEVWYGILVKKSAGLPVIRISTGVNQATGAINYKWFTTDPSYLEPVVTSKATASSYNSIKLTWTPATGVDGYDIYRSTSSAGTFTKISSTTDPTAYYTNTGLNTGTTYYYKIQTYFTFDNGEKIYGAFSPVVSAKPVLAVPASPKAASASYSSIKTSWTAVSGASGYEVSRATSSTGTYSVVGNTTTATSLTNTGLSTNKVYYYKIRAYRMVGTTKVYGGYTTVVSAKPIPSVPTNFKAASASYSSIKTSWTAVSGASGYEVFRATSSTGTYSLVGKTTTATSFTNTGLSTNKLYYYKIKAYRTVGTTKVYSGYTTVVSAKPIPSVPTNFKAARYSSTSIKTTWSAVTGASGYEVYRATSSTGTYSLVKNTTSLYFTNTGLTTGRTYYYKARSYKLVGTVKVYSGWTAVSSARP